MSKKTHIILGVILFFAILYFAILTGIRVFLEKKTQEALGVYQDKVSVSYREIRVDLLLRRLEWVGVEITPTENLGLFYCDKLMLDDWDFEAGVFSAKIQLEGFKAVLAGDLKKHREALGYDDDAFDMNVSLAADYHLSTNHLSVKTNIDAPKLLQAALTSEISGFSWRGDSSDPLTLSSLDFTCLDSSLLSRLIGYGSHQFLMPKEAFIRELSNHASEYAKLLGSPLVMVLSKKIQQNPQTESFLLSPGAFKLILKPKMGETIRLEDLIADVVDENKISASLMLRSK